MLLRSKKAPKRQPNMAAPSSFAAQKMSMTAAALSTATAVDASSSNPTAADAVGTMPSAGPRAAVGRKPTAKNAMEKLIANQLASRGRAEQRDAAGRGASKQKNHRGRPGGSGAAGGQVSAI